MFAISFCTSFYFSNPICKVDELIEVVFPTDLSFAHSIDFVQEAVLSFQNVDKLSLRATHITFFDPDAPFLFAKQSIP